MEGDLASSTGLISTITLAAGAAITWGISTVLKRFGITPSSFDDRNTQAAKDMLDFQREQLRDEVARREKAEDEVQALLQKLHSIGAQMERRDIQNEKLQEQVKILTATVEELTSTVNQLKEQVERGRS